MFEYPGTKMLVASITFFLAIFIGTQILPAQKAATKVGVDQEVSRFMSQTEVVGGTLPMGQTFTAAKGNITGVDLAFQTVPMELTLKVIEWPVGRTIVEVMQDSSQGDFRCGEAHPTGQGAVCHFEWGRAYALNPGQKYAAIVSAAGPDERYTFWKATVDYHDGCAVDAGAEVCSAGDVFFRTYTSQK